MKKIKNSFQNLEDNQDNMSSTPSFIENFKFEISHENLRRLNEAIERLFEKWSPYGFNNLTDIGFGISQLNYQLNVKENLSVDMLHENLCKFSNDWTKKAAEAFETNQFESEAENKTADIPDCPKEIETKNPPVNVFVNPTFVFGESSYRCNVNVYQQVTTITLPDKSQVTINCECRWQPAADLTSPSAAESIASAEAPKGNKKGRKKKTEVPTPKTFTSIGDWNKGFLCNKLCALGFLDKNTPASQFESLFDDKYLDVKIAWRGTDESLAYFIRLLVKNNLINNHKFWRITAQRFVGTNRKRYDSEKLSKDYKKGETEVKYTCLANIIEDMINVSKLAKSKRPDDDYIDYWENMGVDEKDLRKEYFRKK